MLAARFEEVQVTDVTNEFLDTARRWAAGFDEHDDELRDLVGPEWDERQRDRRRMLQAAEEGLLLRLLVTGKRD